MSARFSSRAWSLAALLAALACAGCAKPLSEIVLVTSTDFGVPAQLDEVDFTAQGPSGMSVQRSATMLGAAGAPAFPLTLALVPSGDALGPVTVTVVGRLRGTEVVRQTRRTSFVRGERLTLPIALLRSCAADRTVQCTGEQTCVDGACATIDVPPGSLAPWDAGATTEAGLDAADGNSGDGGPGMDAGDAAADRVPADALDGTTGTDAAQDAVASDACGPDADLSSLANCGSCGHACNVVHSQLPYCNAGRCAYYGSCETGWGDCDGDTTNGCETDLTSTSANCGTCGHACSAGSACVASACATDGAAEVSAGGNSTCVRRLTGALGCWGENDVYQLGDGTMVNRPAPVTVASISDAIMVRERRNNGCAIRAGGTVWCWGSNDEGQLGGGASSSSGTPVQVGGVTGATAIAVGNHHACALRGDHSVVCWGRGLEGQLGAGSFTSSPTPVQAALPAPNDAVEIEANNATTCARRTGGSVVCWGLNDHGQVGDGSMTNRAAPTAVMNLSGVAEVAVGFAFACARHSDGTLVCWGDDSHGQLGDGTTSATPRLAPGAAVLVINGINGATSISAGHDHACARRSNSTVWCWGDNTYDQSNSSGGTPSNVDSSFTDAVDVSLGDYHSCARRSTGGHVACWGDDDFVQLGSSLPGSSWPFPTDVDGIP